MSWARLAAMFERMENANHETKRRAQLCDHGGHSWYCVFAPFRFRDLETWAPATPMQMQHRKERFHRAPQSTRPVCGAKTRSGAPCRARVVIREDGTPARRCRMHGGLSTGPRTKKGRARIAQSNRRRSKSTVESGASEKV